MGAPLISPPRQDPPPRALGQPRQFDRAWLQLALLIVVVAGGFALSYAFFPG